MIIYPDTEKELFFDKDYKPLPPLRGLPLDSLRELYGNLCAAQENAWLYGADMLTIALEMDIRKVDMYIRMYEKKERREKHVEQNKA